MSVTTKGTLELVGYPQHIYFFSFKLPTVRLKGIFISH